MRKVFDVIAMAAGAVCGFLFGELNGLMIALIAMVILDYITGVLASVAEKKLSSEVGFKGICKKILLFILVAVANIIDVYVIGGGSALKTAVIFVFVANEGLSILENAARLGVPIPQKLKKALAQLKDKGENDDDNEDN